MIWVALISAVLGTAGLVVVLAGCMNPEPPVQLIEPEDLKD